VLRHPVGADHKDISEAVIRPDKLGAGIQSGHEAGAGRIQIKGPARACLELVLHDRGRRRRKIVGRICRDDDEIEIPGGDPGLLQGFSCGRDDQVRGGLLGRHVASLADIPLLPKEGVDVHAA